MKNLAFFALALVLIFSWHATAQTEKPDGYEDAQAVEVSVGSTHRPDPIYATLGECLGKNPSTAGMPICYDAAYKAYDALLNKIYKIALDSIDEPSRAQLRIAQNKWLVFRDAEFEMYKKSWKFDKGTIVGSAIDAREITMIRERISELTLYTGMIEQ